jgi:ubiquinone/menaquinone biosynthesis C-methylase UbiE
MKQVLKDLRTRSLRMLHFAPEPFLRSYFSRQFYRYETADLDAPDVDHKVDLLNLPFASQTYDFVFASHVLEHIEDDARAIAEVRRILRPNGIAVLPVPLVADRTIEYPEPNPTEFGHVRAPGFDYFHRFDRYFSRVDTYTSDALPDKYQLFIYEDRTRWPTRACPLRRPMQGEKHIDVVPVCYV